MSEIVDTTKKVFVVEKQCNEQCEKRLSVNDELCAWLERHQVIVWRGDLCTLRSMCGEHEFAVILLTQSDIGDVQQQVSLLREQTSAMLMYISDEDTASAVTELFKTDIDEVLLPSMPLEERGGRILNQIRLGDKLFHFRAMYHELYAKYEQVLKQNEELELLSKADALTGLFSRRYMMRKLQEETARNQRSRHTFSVLICSVDSYEAFMENEGREVSDSIVKEIASVLMNSCRAYDIVARWNEEQFMLLLPETDLTWALVVAERCRKNVERYLFERDGRRMDLSLTIGMSEFRQTDGVGGCVRRSEHALKEGKQRGSNCIVFCSTVGSEMSYITYSLGNETE